MQVRRPWEWSFGEMWKRMRRAGAQPAGSARLNRPPDPEPDPEPQDEKADDLLRRMSDVCWRLLIVGVVVGLMLWALSYVWVVVLPVILAIFLTALLMPPAELLRRRGMGRGLSTLITVLGALAVLGGVITLVVQPAIQGFGGLVQSVDEAIGSIQRLSTSLGLDPQLFSQIFENAGEELQSILTENRDQLVSGAWAAGTAVLGGLTGVILILVLTVYFVHSGDRLVEWIRALVPAGSWRPLRAAGEITYGVMGRYVRGVALVGLIDAVGIGMFLIFLVDYNLAIPLIVLIFIGAFLPVIGAFVTGLLAAVVAFVTEGVVIALVVVAVVLVVQQLESNVFAPRVYGKALELPSAIVLLAISLGFVVAGITGMFLATPVAAVLAALLRNRPLAPSDGGAAKPTGSGDGQQPVPAGDRSGGSPDTGGR